MNPSLKHAADLINAHQRDEAHQILSRYLDEQPEDSGAWYLRSFTAPEASEKIAAAKRAVTLNPTSEKFHTRLVQLQTGNRVPETRTRFKRSIAAALVAVVIVVLLGAWGLSQNLQPASRQLPTLIALADSPDDMSTAQSTITSQEITPSGVAISATHDPQITPESGVPSTVSVPSTLESVRPSVTGTAASTSQIIATAQTVSTSGVASLFVTTIPLNSSIAASVNATATQEAVITATFAATTSTTQISVAPSATGAAPIAPTVFVPVIVDNAAPLYTGLDIGIGEMRVISATRPAESYIRDLGGSVPPAPSNQSWVLVEVLLICHQQNVCTADPATLAVVGSSGTSYTSSPSLSMTPLLGESQINGQIWGYIGFIVPNSESRLTLTFSQGNENHIFALQ